MVKSFGTVKNKICDPIIYRGQVYFKRTVNKTNKDGKRIFYHYKGKLKGKNSIYFLAQCSKSEYNKFKKIAAKKI